MASSQSNAILLDEMNFALQLANDTQALASLYGTLVRAALKLDALRMLLEQLQVDDILQQLASGNVKLENLVNHGSTAAEYYQVLDRVMKYRQEEHNWHPQITEIQKIINPKLEGRYEGAKEHLWGEKLSALLFHGTNSEAVLKIITKGFKLPQTGGMYGKGIYFATDSSKSAQEIYTKGSNKLILCDVLLGRSHTAKGPLPHMTKEKLDELKCDSIFAVRGSKPTGGVKYDEHVVYDEAQALPKYLISYKV